MFGWVDHAAALDGFLFRYAVCPLCLSSSVVVCRLSSSSSVARLLCPYCRQQWGRAGVGHATTPRPCWENRHGTGTSVRLSTPAVVGRTNMQ